MSSIIFSEQENKVMYPFLGEEYSAFLLAI